MFKRCKHDWEIIQETTTESRAELQGKLTGKVAVASNSFDHQYLYKRKHITILKCKNCPKLKRFVEEI